MRLSPRSGDPMDGVEQLLLERVLEALNHAGPFDALACQGIVMGSDSVSQLRGEGRAIHHGAFLSLYPGEHRKDLKLIYDYTAYLAYRIYIMIYSEPRRRSP